MYTAHAQSGQVIDLRPSGTAPQGTKRATLVKAGGIEMIRLAVSAGDEVPPYEVSGEVVVQCLEGRLALTVQGTPRTLEAGQLIHLPGGEPHRLGAIENSSVLVTRRVPDSEPKFDVVEEASEESFPASDPPSSW